MLFWSSKAIRQDDGEPLKEGGTIITHGLIAFRALNADIPDDKVEPSVKYERYKLASRLHGPKADKEPINLTIEDAALIKKLVGKVFPPFIMGQVWDALEEQKQVKSPEKVK